VKRLLVAITSLLLITGCYGYSDKTPVPVIEIAREIPPDFVTYTSEGLFSISYPPALIDMASRQEEIAEDVKETMQATDPEFDLESFQYVFTGIIPTDNDANAFLLVTVEPVALGMPLDVYYQYLAEECKRGGEYFMGFRLHSLAKTVVGGREAILWDIQTLDSELGEDRSLNLSMIKDSLLWEVSCSAEPEDFEDYEDTFYSILSSFRILTNWRSRWGM
jgi:hypothetical protein